MKIRTMVGLIVSLALAGGCQTIEPTPEAAPPAAPPPVAAPPPPPPQRPNARPPPVATPSPNAPNAPVNPSGSAQPPTVSSSPSSNTSNAPAVTDPRLTDGIAAYDLGDYNGAIRKLNIKELLESASLDVQVEARKFLAFSYCVTRRAALCKQQFDAALKSKPSFDLKPAEAGHPSWGPVFKKAKADALKK
jgi:hypothetical protein